MSVVECDNPSLYTKGVPSMRGLLDYRMGTVDRRLPCGTCHCGVLQCPGHWGRIELTLPVIHTSFSEAVRKVLNCICHECSRLRLTDAEIEKHEGAGGGDDASSGDSSTFRKKQILGAIYNSCRTKKRCPHCAAPTHLVKKDPHSFGVSLLVVTPSGSIPLHAQDIRGILSAMCPKDIEVLQLDPVGSHPANMVLEALLVPPPAIRPSIMVSEGSRARGQDDLTVRLVEIMKYNAALAVCLKEWAVGNATATAPFAIGRKGGARAAWGEALHSEAVVEAWDKLALNVAVYMQNNPRSSKVATQRSGVPTKCLFGRLKGKAGRFRSNLMGKRVNFSGRSVISPDPMLDVDEVGVPQCMAMQLTVQEKVTKNNIEQLTARILRGANNLAGAETLITSDGRTISLEFCAQRDQIYLSEGWIVERPLQDGDWVIFNRQPTLHRSSLMGHRVRIVPGSTLRCNLAVVTPYNADFDGDEMNIHVPQSPATVAEVRGLMSVTEQLTSPQASRPVMGVVQDALLGAHLMTSPDTLLSKSEFMTTLSATERRELPLAERCYLPPPAFATGDPSLDRWTGKQLFEVLLRKKEVSMRLGDPVDLWAVLEEGSDPPVPMQVAEQPFVMVSGRILCGQFTKRSLGLSASSLPQRVLLTHGNAAAISFLGDVQRMANRWLLEHGFSIGIGDCVPSNACDIQMRSGIDEVMERIDTLYADLPRSSAIAVGDGDRGQTTVEDMAVERAIHRMVGGVQMKTGTWVRKEMRAGNGLGAMVLAGSKGNPINICQIMLCVGQNCTNGSRIKRDGADQRTLPCYAPGDASVDGAGFVANSYVLGLTARESFFHAKGGREGLVDTAVKTSKTGYIQRRLVKAMESNHVQHNLTVRDAAGNIVEFLCGGDGMNPSKLERVDYECLSLPEGELRRRVIMGGGATEGEFQQIRELRDRARGQLLHVLRGNVPRHTNLPVNPRRVLDAVCRQRKARSARTCTEPIATSEALGASLDELCDRLLEAIGDHGTVALRLVLRYELRSAEVLHRRALTSWGLRELMSILHSTLLNAIAEAGEMVGCIAAQSIGEPVCVSENVVEQFLMLRIILMSKMDFHVEIENDI